ncbi:hypothetical protein ACK3TF_000637 [Chlorella vulgaris]
MGHHSENIPYGIRTRVLSIDSTGVLRLGPPRVEAKRKSTQKPKVDFCPNYISGSRFSAFFFLGLGRCFARIASLPRFSAFGRGFATAAYGVSKLLYHAEFTGHPPEQHMAELMRVTAKVVDRGQAPGDATRKFAGLAGWALAGRPADGGFGALPWREHITSRHACLPPVADVAEQPLVLGPWCWAAPLWGNLYFCSPNFPTGIDHDFIDLSAAGVTSLGQLLHLEQAVAAAPGGAAYALVWTTMLGRYAAFASRFYAVERLAALLAALPPAWVHAARAAAAELAAGLLQPPALADALAVTVLYALWPAG